VKFEYLEKRISYSSMGAGDKLILMTKLRYPRPLSATFIWGGKEYIIRHLCVE
jgi:hypothetical protein